eukprot:1404972-Pleurochrysis_carterae.AAC.2
MSWPNAVASFASICHSSYACIKSSNAQPQKRRRALLTTHARTSSSVVSAAKVCRSAPMSVRMLSVAVERSPNAERAAAAGVETNAGWLKETVMLIGEYPGFYKYTHMRQGTAT